MRSSHFEVLVPLPHLVAIDRLPAAVTSGGVTLTTTGGAGGADVVGTLRAHVAEATWHWGRRTGPAQIEIVRTHVDRCAITVGLHGLPIGTAAAIAGELRRMLVAAAADRQPARLAAAGAAEATRSEARPA